MVTIIKRTTDNKYLQSLDNDLWVDNINEAFEMTYLECKSAKLILSNTYTEEQIKEIMNFSKVKPLTKEDRKELRDLLKK